MQVNYFGSYLIFIAKSKEVLFIYKISGLHLKLLFFFSIAVYQHFLAEVCGNKRDGTISFLPKCSEREIISNLKI